MATKCERNSRTPVGVFCGPHLRHDRRHHRHHPDRRQRHRQKGGRHIGAAGIEPIRIILAGRAQMASVMKTASDRGHAGFQRKGAETDKGRHQDQSREARKSRAFPSEPEQEPNAYRACRWSWVHSASILRWEIARRALRYEEILTIDNEDAGLQARHRLFEMEESLLASSAPGHRAALAARTCRCFLADRFASSTACLPWRNRRCPWPSAPTSSRMALLFGSSSALISSQLFDFGFGLRLYTGPFPAWTSRIRPSCHLPSCRP